MDNDTEETTKMKIYIKLTSTINGVSEESFLWHIQDRCMEASLKR